MDPYLLTNDKTADPPTSFWGKMKHVGPGFILSASIVGSGELIATTLAGAQAGFVLMWFIIFSCLVKVAVQLEFGKHAILSGQSTMASFNDLPGPKLLQANWTIWTWLLLMLGKMLQVGGIVGGVVLAMVHFFPMLLADSGDNNSQLSTLGVVVLYLVAASVALLVYQGYYLLIEKASLIMIAAFTIFTLASLVALQQTEFAISSGEIWNGMIPSLPENSVVLMAAIGAFGITGVGGDEIMAYNYWLIEKGYAAYTGPRDDSPEWTQRAKGWIGIMYWDAILAMIAYTSMTVMFYLLGAAVLHRQNKLPAKSELISTLGDMYTSSLGPWARTVFVIGAIVVLYSTLFAALAAWSRMFADAFGRIGLYNFEDEKSRKKAIAIGAWVIPIGWATLYLLIAEPGKMVILGGLATVVILLIVVFATLYFRYRQAGKSSSPLDESLLPGFAYDAWLWLSAIAIFLVAAYGIYDGVYKKLVS